ncbi:MAG TPA: hypothetical protein VMT00_14095 [Thermoanaerobaculia bacterium]|nr:hypothetical protein [Thermoanaerobaculia bacterium]
MTGRSLFASLLLLHFAISCASSQLPSRPNEKEWTRLLAAYQNLETLRLTAPSPPENATRKQQIEIVLETHKRLETVYGTFIEELKEYHQRTGDARAAKLYANERIRMGDEYMGVLSRYDRAAGMYRAALALDPENAAAKERLALAEAKRFVPMTSFGAVRSGMREEEVRRIVGMPREDWIKQVVQRGRNYSVWIYPKVDGGAAAIYFDNGVVYYTNWNAAAPATETRDGSPQR